MRSLEAQIIEINKLNLIEKRWTTLALKGQRQTLLCSWVNESSSLGLALTGCDRWSGREREREKEKEKEEGSRNLGRQAVCILLPFNFNFRCTLHKSFIARREMATTGWGLGVDFGVHLCKHCDALQKLIVSCAPLTEHETIWITKLAAAASSAVPAPLSLCLSQVDLNILRAALSSAFSVSFHYFWLWNNKQQQQWQQKLDGSWVGQHDVYVLLVVLRKTCYAQIVVLNLIYALANSQIPKYQTTWASTALECEPQAQQQGVYVIL